MTEVSKEHFNPFNSLRNQLFSYSFVGCLSCNGSLLNIWQSFIVALRLIREYGALMLGFM